jgi:hypothetical protein
MARLMVLLLQDIPVALVCAVAGVRLPVDRVLLLGLLHHAHALGALAAGVTETLLPPGAATAEAPPLVPPNRPSAGLVTSRPCAHTSTRHSRTSRPGGDELLQNLRENETTQHGACPNRVRCSVVIRTVPLRVVMLDLAGVLHPAGRVLLRHLRLLLGLLHAHTLLTRQRRRADAPPSRVTGSSSSQQSLAPRRQHHRL